MNKIMKNQQGYIALIAVLIIVVATLAIGLSLNSLSIGETQSGLMVQQFVQSQSIADSCMQEAYQKLRFDGAYVGESLNLGQGSCTITVIPSGADHIITVQSDVKNIITKLESSITVVGNNITVNYWQNIYI
ncbi:MAG: hypothetical protein Q8P20_10265 [bacterium]|nr:hypothetical protein [bacterium]